MELGKVYKLPFSNYKTYILLHVYFKIGGGELGGNHGGFCFGVGCGFWGLGFLVVLLFVFFCKLLVQKKQEEKLEVVLFWKCSIHFKLIKHCEFVKLILFFNKFAIVNCYSVLKRTAKLSFNK